MQSGSADPAAPNPTEASQEPKDPAAASPAASPAASAGADGAGWHPHLWHPCTQRATAQAPERIVRGEGAELISADGRRLIDAIGSWWVTLHGHGEPSIAAAIAAQAQALEQVIFADFSHPAAETLATRLSGHTGLERVFFSDNGSTAVEVALKVAWQWWRNLQSPRYQLVAFAGAYHGDTFGAMSLGERSLFSQPFDPLLFSVARVPWPATHWHDEAVDEREQQALNALDAVLETPTAAVILEPLVQGASGMRMVRESFLRQLEQRVRAAGALLIADEVLTGFGRSGALFACQRAQIQPDLIALSKGLTGGFLPMGVTLVSERVFEGFVGLDPRLTLFHGHSFTANPLGCAAALASLDLLERFPERHQQLEARHRPRLEALAGHARVRRPRLLGGIAAFDLAVDNPGYLNPAGKRLQALVREQGVYLRPLGDVVYLLPPLCISDEQLDRCYHSLHHALDAL